MGSVKFTIWSSLGGGFGSMIVGRRVRVRRIVLGVGSVVWLRLIWGWRIARVI